MAEEAEGVLGSLTLVDLRSTPASQVLAAREGQVVVLKRSVVALAVVVQAALALR